MSGRIKHVLNITFLHSVGSSKRPASSPQLGTESPPVGARGSPYLGGRVLGGRQQWRRR